MLHLLPLCGSSKYVILNFIHNRFQVEKCLFAKENGNCAAGREFKVDKRCIRRWRGQEGVLIKRPTRGDRYDMTWQSFLNLTLN